MLKKHSRRLALVASLALTVLLLIGCGENSLRTACESIGWKGQQCGALKRVEWAKANGIPPHTVKGYYSLPEDAR
jgi:hypothetical protein